MLQHVGAWKHLAQKPETWVQVINQHVLLQDGLLP